MGRWGSCDFKQIRELQKRLEWLAKEEQRQFCEAIARELAARLLAKVIHRTPVDSGTLRRGWTAGKENLSEKGNVIGLNGKTGYAAGMEITEQNGVYTVTVSNSILYASYVEFGHRTANHKGWVPGEFMLTLSENELRAEAPALIQKKLAAHLQRCLDGK